MKIEKVLFMGSAEIGIPTLEKIKALYNKNLIGIITQPDAPKGRSKIPQPTKIKEWALLKEIITYEPKSKEKLTEQILKLDPDLIIVFAYGKILPQIITDTFFCVNIHASVLPKYRGASPIQTALLNGDKETGLTLIKMNEKMDEGDILKIKKIKINDNDNYGSLSHKMSLKAQDILLEWIKDLKNKNITTTKQDHSNATYCRKIEKKDLEIKNNLGKSNIVNKIRAFAPQPGAYTVKNGKRIKILKARLENNEIIIEIIKPEGKKEMTYKDYCLGNNEGIELC